MTLWKPMKGRLLIGPAQAGLSLALILRAIDREEVWEDRDTARLAVKMMYRYSQLVGLDDDRFEGKPIFYYDEDGKAEEAYIGEELFSKEEVLRHA